MLKVPITPTRPEWLQTALGDLVAIYQDHLHCERKAAQTALSLVRSYPDRHDLVRGLTRLAHEETSHVIVMTKILDEHQAPSTFDWGDEYASQLRRLCRKSEPDRMLDRLLIFGLIETRSAERLGMQV